MRKAGNPILFKVTLVSVVMAIVIVRGINEVWPQVLSPSIPMTAAAKESTPSLDTRATPVPGMPRPILIVDHDVRRANLITINDNGLESVRFFELYRRTFDERCGANVWSRWLFRAVIGKTIYDIYVFVDELVYRGNLYEYKARAVDINSNQVGTWSDVLQRRVPHEGQKNVCR